MSRLREMNSFPELEPLEDPWSGEAPAGSAASGDIPARHELRSLVNEVTRTRRRTAAAHGIAPRAVAEPPDDRFGFLFGRYPRQAVDPRIGPWSAVCHLEITTRMGGTDYGTGWLISPTTVITAGHCVYFHGSSPGPAQRVLVSPGRAGGAFPFGRQYSAAVNSVNGWMQQRLDRYDYGVIFLRDPFPGDPGYFGCAALSDDQLKNQVLTVAGYPIDKEAGTQWRAAGPMKLEREMLVYDLDTEQGQSGAPAFVMQGNQPIVVGIHGSGTVSTLNIAARVTPASLPTLLQWRDMRVR